MSPRRYSMGRRADSAATTRQRIVESTLELHSANGILGTSWKDIAARADVSVGTVYKHFPSLDELLPACGALMMERYQPPGHDDAETLVAGSADPGERLAAVVAAVYGFYHRAGPAAEIDPRERRLPAIIEWEAYWADTLAGFVEVALRPLAPSPHTIAVASAMLDQRTFAALTARGVPADVAAWDITQMIMAWLGTAGTTTSSKETT